MSVTQNGSLEEHLDSLSKRLAMPTVLMIWNMSFSYFPQILLRTPDDVKGHECTLLLLHARLFHNFLSYFFTLFHLNYMHGQLQYDDL